MSTRELIDRELEVLPEPLQREVYDFVCFLKQKEAEQASSGGSAATTAVRNHSAFLNSYSPEDEGLYDDYSAG
jgi:hypothetical protein